MFSIRSKISVYSSKNLDLDSPASRYPDSDLIIWIRQHGSQPNILSDNQPSFTSIMIYFWFSTTLSITSSPSTIPTPSPTPAASAPRPSGLCAYILYFFFTDFHCCGSLSGRIRIILMDPDPADPNRYQFQAQMFLLFPENGNMLYKKYLKFMALLPFIK